MQRGYKSVLITGCSTGIGLASALHLKNLGYHVIASARKASDVEKLISLGLSAVELDLSCRDKIEEGLSLAIEKNRSAPFYAVFHNAGYGQSGALEDIPVEALAEQFQVNLFGAHQINQRLIPMMRQEGEGRIIWNSSVLGFFAMKYRGSYNASKFAMEGMADTLRLELKGSGIYVSIIEPGPVATDFRKNSLAAFLHHVSPEKSVHATSYRPFIERLEKVGDTSKFTLPADACNESLVHALESRTPKHRYRVTTPTKIMAVLKRVLPSTITDRIAERGF